MNTDRGAAQIGTSSAIFVFLTLLYAAVQVAFDLYATTMVTAEARDAARSVAGFDAGPDRCAAAAEAEVELVRALGPYGTEAGVRLEWVCDDTGVVRLRVTARHPSILTSGFPPGLDSLGELDRTIEVRVESPR